MCCLFGLIDYQGSLTAKQKNRILRELSIAAEERGTDATGIAYNTERGLQVYKRPLPAHRMHFKVPADAHVVMGHTRMATQGRAKRNENNHPFLGSIGRERFALAHNGVLYNDYSLRSARHLPKTKIETDSYIAVQLIEQQKALDLRFMAEQVEGSFTFTVLTERDELYFVKGDNPLCLVHFPLTGTYVYASTAEILNAGLLHTVQLHVSFAHMYTCQCLPDLTLVQDFVRIPEWLISPDANSTDGRWPSLYAESGR